MPAYGHALPIEGSRPLRLVDPEQLVRAFWDALADTLVRTPAAARRSTGWCGGVRGGGADGS